MYVGIDCSKNRHDVCFFEKETGKKQFLKIKNNKEDFKKIAAKMPKDHLIAVESTGVYSQHIFQFFKGEGLNIIMLYPYQVKKLLQAMNKSKTDKIDSQTIAIIIAHMEGFLKKVDVQKEKYDEIKVLMRHHQDVVELFTKSQKRLKNNLYLIMPELEKYFTKMKSNVLLEILEKYPTPEKIIINKTEVQKIIGNYWKESKKTKFFEDLANTIGIRRNIEVYEVIIQSQVKTLVALGNEIKEIETKIKALSDRIPNNLKSWKGIGTLTIATILGEVGNVERFATKKEIVSYSGLDPKINESGQKKIRCKISKRGSKFLRRMLYLAAMRLIRYDKKFKEYYERMKAKGKHSKLILTAICRKIMEIIYILLKTNQEYKPMV